MMRVESIHVHVHVHVYVHIFMKDQRMHACGFASWSLTQPYSCKSHGLPQPMAASPEAVAESRRCARCALSSKHDLRLCFWCFWDHPSDTRQPQQVQRTVVTLCLPVDRSQVCAIAPPPPPTNQRHPISTAPDQQAAPGEPSSP